MRGMSLKSLWDRVTNPEDYIHYDILLCRTVGLLLPSDKYLLYSVLLALCLFVHLITEVIDLVLIYNDVEKVATNLTITILTSAALQRLLTLVFFKEKYHDLVYETYRSFGTVASVSSDRTGTRKRLKGYRFLAMCYFLLGSSVLFFYLSNPLILQQRVLPYRAWYPFRTDGTFVYPALYFLHFIAEVAAGLLMMSVDMMYTTLMQLTCIQLDIISETLQNCREMAANAVNEKERRWDERSHAIDLEMNKILRWCAEFHNILLKRIAKIENLHWPIMLGNFLGQIMLMCFLGLEATSTSNNNPLKLFNQLIYLAVSVLQVYLLCSNGDRLITSQLNVSYAAYNSQWFTSSESLKRTLRIIIIRAQTPLRISVGKVADLNLITFSETLSRAYSYFTVLRQVKLSELT